MNSNLYDDLFTSDMFSLSLSTKAVVLLEFKILKYSERIYCYLAWFV